MNLKQIFCSSLLYVLIFLTLFLCYCLGNYVQPSVYLFIFIQISTENRMGVSWFYMTLRLKIRWRLADSPWNFDWNSGGGYLIIYGTSTKNRMVVPGFLCTFDRTSTDQQLISIRISTEHRLAVSWFCPWNLNWESAGA